jgi:hypothetical protein
MTPKRTIRKLKNFETSKYQIRKPSKFTRRKAKHPLSPLVKLHTKN